MMDIITVNGSDRDGGAGEDVIYKFYKCCTAPGSLEYDETDPAKKFMGTGQILGTDLNYDPSTGTYTGSDTPGAEKTPSTSIVAADVDGATYDDTLAPPEAAGVSSQSGSAAPVSPRSG